MAVLGISRYSTGRYSTDEQRVSAVYYYLVPHEYFWIEHPHSNCYSTTHTYHLIVLHQEVNNRNCVPTSTCSLKSESAKDAARLEGGKQYAVTFITNLVFRSQPLCLESSVFRQISILLEIFKPEKAWP